MLRGSSTGYGTAVLPTLQPRKSLCLPPAMSSMAIATQQSHQNPLPNGTSH